MNKLKFKNWSIFTKLFFLIAVSLIPILLIFVAQVIPSISEKYNKDKRASIQNVVETTYKILEIYNGKYVSGKLTLEEAQNQAIDEINTLRYNGNEYFFLYDYDGVLMASGAEPEKRGLNRLDIVDKNGIKIIQEMINISKSQGGGFLKYYFPKPGESTPSPKLSYVKEFKPWNAFYGCGVYVDDVEQEISSFVNSLYIPIIVAILIALVVGFFLARAISALIKKLDDEAKKIENGATNIDLDINSEDEIGHLAKSFVKMVNNLKEKMNEANEKGVLAQKAAEEADRSKHEIELQQKYLAEKVDVILVGMEKFAQGDLTVNLEVTKDDSIGQLFRGFNMAVQKIKDIISKVTEAAMATASASNQISSSIEEMAAGSQEQSAQTTEIAGAVEEMSKTIIETTRNASVASDNAKEAGKLAIEGGKVVSKTIEGMEKISEVVTSSAQLVFALGKNSDKIGEIVQVINDIADQTNLLALNAAIEAARAGEQGRGFAVVADEVRKLAERTTRATKEIADMIKQIQQDTGNAVVSMEKGISEVDLGKNLVNEAGNVLKKIITSSEKVSDLIAQVAAASEEQSTASEEISKNIEGINNVTKEASSGIHQIARAAEDLNSLTVNLQDLVSKFKIDESYSSNKYFSPKKIRA